MAKDVEGIEDQSLENVEGAEGGEAKVDETKYIPIERFNEVYGKYKDLERGYKEWGDMKPAEVKVQLAKLKEWEKAVDEAKKAANATPDEKQAAERATRVRKELMSIYPELGNLTKISDLEKALTELRGMNAEATAKEVLAEHSKNLTPVLKTLGIDPKYQDDIEEFLVSKMSEEEKLAFLQGDFDVAKNILEAQAKEGMLASLVKKTAPIPPALRVPAGGTNAPGKKPKPISMKEAEELGWARMNSGE